MSKRHTARSIRATPEQIRNAPWYTLNLWGELSFRYAAIDVLICRKCWQPFCICKHSKESRTYQNRMELNNQTLARLEQYEAERAA